MSLVQLIGVSKKYGAIYVLQDLNFQIQAGEVVGLFGHNGAGKTTTMKLILGLIEPEKGDVTLFGKKPAGNETARRQLGYLPENVSFYAQLSGREVVRYFARLKNVPPRQADALLEQVGLSAAAHKRVKTYSKGMRQRLGLAQALLGEPRLLLLDEPTVGLDPVATAEFYGLLDQLRQQGSSILLSSHVLPAVERHLQRAIIVGQGKCLALGTVEELRQQAGLPIQIEGRGEWEEQAMRHCLAALPAHLRQFEQGFFKLEVTAANKLEVARQLLTKPEVQDLDIHLPSLESLYLHFTNQLFLSAAD